MPKPAKVPVVVNLQSRDGSLSKDGHLTNAFVEVEGKERQKVFKRGGLNLISQIGSGAGQGITNYVDFTGNEVLYAVNNGQAYLADLPIPGATWSTTSVPDDSGAVLESAYVSFGGYLWAIGGTLAGASGINKVWYKQNISDAAWTLAASGVFSLAFWGASAIVYKGKIFVVGGTTNGAVYLDDVYSSSDGVNWTVVTSAAAFGGLSVPQLIVYNNYLWLVYGYNGANLNGIWRTSDGATWTSVQATPAFTADMTAGYGGVMFNNAMAVVAGTAGGTPTNKVYTSTDGVTWTAATLTSTFTARFYPVVLNNSGVLVVVGGRDAGGGFNDVNSSINTTAWTQNQSSTNIPTTVWTSSGPAGRYATYAYHARQDIIIAGSGTIYYPAAGTTGGVSLLAISIGAGDICDFAKNLDGTQIMVKSMLAAYKINTNAATMTSVTDGDYPVTTVRGCVYLDGTFYVMEADGTIWGSDLEDCTSWNATNFITAEFEPDQGVCLSKYNNYVVAFGQWTTEMFWDAANPVGSPLSPVQNGVILVGCAHANSVCQLESTVLWMAQRKGQGSSFQKGRFIAMLEGQSYVQVSTPDVDRILDADNLATVYSCVGSFSGHNFYILSLGTTGVSLVYDLTQKLWYVWTRCTAGTAVTLTSLTQSNGLATATKSGHGFSDGDPVTIAGATPSGYNLTQVNVTVVSSSVFTYPVSSALSSPATGTITATPVSESYFSMLASCNYQGQQVFQEVTGGKIFSLLNSATADNGFPINWKFRTDRQDQGNNNRKFCFGVTPIGDLGTGTFLLRYSDNDYQTNSTYRRFDLSDVRPQNQRYGNYRRRSWEGRYTGTAITGYRMERLEVDLEQGSS